MAHRGLNEKEVLKLRKKFGENILPVKEGYSWITILLKQFESPLIYILLFAAVISFFVYAQAYTDLVLIGSVIILDVVMGFYQEYNAQKTLVALRKILKPKAIVIREGKRKEVEVKELVPGDLVVLGGGDKVPADGKLAEGVNLLVNEAILTGEEEAIGKIKERNLFMGTTVISGTGIMKVEKIGTETEMGKIGQSLQEIKEEKTPLQLKLEKFAKNLAYIIGGICLTIFLVGILFYQQSILGMLRISVILSVAAIPEALPIAVTVILALGMRKILKRQGLVKKLLSIETLGSTSVICTDKTGTLTEGVMRVVKTDFVDSKKASLALTLANDQRTNLEISLWNYVKEKGFFNPQEIFYSFPRIYDEPFDSEKKYTLKINQIEGKEIAFLLGAPEIILSFCHLSPEEKKNILVKIENWASQGLRILGASFKEKGNLKEKRNYIWLGLIGIRDPIRAGAKEAILSAQEAGIKIKIVTGDYRKTAESVAKNLGFRLKSENVLEGWELETISEEELKNKIDNILLFSRVTPHQKLKIIKALQEKGETVAMTGDGANDAPALKKADIGVVMGGACDVAKEAGHLILLNNNFKTILAACEEGRLVFSNIKKVVAYVLSNSFAEIILIFGAMLLNLPSPLTVVQILWIHLICDGPPDILLSFEPKEESLMKEKPQVIKKEEILGGFIKFIILGISLMTGLLSLFFFWVFKQQPDGLHLARTIAFATIASVSLVYIFAFKNLKKSILKTKNFFQNKYLFWGVAYGFLLIFAAIYLPGLNKILGTVPLKPLHWLIVFSIALMTTLLVEAIKFFNTLKLNRSASWRMAEKEVRNNENSH